MSQALVEDQEGWTRRILDFVGLDWDAHCLDFHQTERRIGTSSNWQARQPIYKTSRERWRNYEAFVGPLLPLLALYDPTMNATASVAADSHPAKRPAISMTDTTPIVARQYTAYSYPHPIEDMREKIAGGYYEYGAPHLF